MWASSADLREREHRPRMSRGAWQPYSIRVATKYSGSQRLGRDRAEEGRKRLWPRKKRWWGGDVLHVAERRNYSLEAAKTVAVLSDGWGRRAKWCPLAIEQEEPCALNNSGKNRRERDVFLRRQDSFRTLPEKSSGSPVESPWAFISAISSLWCGGGRVPGPFIS